MKTEILWSTIDDKKAIFNAMQSGGSLKDIAGNVITVVGIVQYKEIKEDGEARVITAFITAEGETYGSVSDNVADAASALVATFGDITPENPIDVKAVSDTSKNGREFLTLLVC